MGGVFCRDKFCFSFLQSMQNIFSKNLQKTGRHEEIDIFRFAPPAPPQIRKRLVSEKDRDIMIMHIFVSLDWPFYLLHDVL